jgi:hypothetical protein
MKALGLASLAALALMMVAMLLTTFPQWRSMSAGELAGELKNTLLMLSALMILFGWPAFFVLLRLNWLSGRSFALACFLMGTALGVCASLVGRAFSGQSFRGTLLGQPVRMIVDDRVTLFGYLAYAEATLLLAVHAAAAAFVFYCVWQRVSATQKAPQAN